MSLTPGPPVDPHMLWHLVEAVDKNFKKTGSSVAEQIAQRYERLLFEFKGRDQLDAPEVADVFADVVDRVGIPFVHLSRPAPKEQFYYRARLLFDDHENLRADPSQFGPPPAAFTPAGRANLKGFPVFYGADDPETAIAETTSSKSVSLYLSRWRSGLFRPWYVYSMATDKYRTEKLQNQRNRLLRVTEDLFAYVSSDACSAAAATLEGMGRVFVEDTDYALSSLLGHQYLYNDRLHGIEYPDATRKLGLNYALGPAMFDKLILESVSMFHVWGHKRAISVVGEPSAATGQLVWRDFDPKID